MEYKFRFEAKMTAEEQFNEVIGICNELEAFEKAIIFDFGLNRDLVLHIYKDEDYNPLVDEEKWNLVRIHTAQGGEWVDDTEDTHVTDGSLYNELYRIWMYKDFATL